MPVFTINRKPPLEFSTPRNLGEKWTAAGRSAIMRGRNRTPAATVPESLRRRMKIDHTRGTRCVDKDH
jgi:hypothetical protein